MSRWPIAARPQLAQVADALTLLSPDNFRLFGAPGIDKRLAIWYTGVQIPLARRFDFFAPPSFAADAIERLKSSPQFRGAVCMDPNRQAAIARSEQREAAIGHPGDSEARNSQASHHSKNEIIIRNH